MAAGHEIDFQTRRGLSVTRATDKAELCRALREAFGYRPVVPAWFDAATRIVGDNAAQWWKDRDEELEAHIRLGIVDRVLKALGWNFSDDRSEFDWSGQNISIEVSLRPVEEDTVTKMDYLGWKTAGKRALFIVETKEPGLSLAKGPDAVESYRHPLVQDLHIAASSIEEVRKRSALSKEWRKAVKQLGDYVRGLSQSGHAPKQAVLTNGEWFIAFDSKVMTDTVHAFEQNNPGVYVFDSHDRVLREIDLFWKLTSFRALAENLHVIPVNQIAGCIDSSRIAATLNGVRVLHTKDRKWDKLVPRLEVSPITVIIGQGGGAVVVHSGEDSFLRIPSGDEPGLMEHLKKMAASADELRTEINRVLGIHLPVAMTVDGRLTDGKCDFGWGPVHQIDGDDASDRYYVVTGSHTHFLVPDDRIHECTGHHFAKITVSGNRLDEIVLKPSLNPRAAFADGHACHCAHRSVHEARSSPRRISSEGIQESSLPVSLCFMRPIDTYLCCRSCCFVTICWNSSAMKPHERVCSEGSKTASLT